jgi:ABC-type nitrate/sulfonate/bicarbonate transport system permease component
MTSTMPVYGPDASGPEVAGVAGAAGPSRRPLRGTFITVLAPLALMAVLIALWQLATVLYDLSPVVLPPPTLVAETVVDEWSTLLDNLWITLLEILLGFGAGLVCGVALGIAIASSRTLQRALYPLVIGSQVVPVFAIAPLLIIWFGFGIVPKVVIAAVVVFFPICVNQVEGIRSVDPRVIDLMRSYSASSFQIFRFVRFPASIPYLIAGTQIGIAYSVIAAVIAEWVGASEGLGWLMLSANAVSNTKLVFACIVVLGVVGIGLFWLIGVIGGLLAPWLRKASE